MSSGFEPLLILNHISYLYRKIELATNIILFASPFFFLLIIIEIWADYKKKREVYRFNDAMTSLSLGVISQTQKIIVFSLSVLVYDWIINYLAVPQLGSDSAFTWIFAFVFYDFLYYWYHRFSHQINFLWAAHVVHHQSEEYNLTTALRQTSSSLGVWVFYIPSFLIGVPTEVFFVSGALNLIYQFWVHTQLIGKLGWFETIFVTPSHHRVHHGQNQIYIDKNHGGVFIIWDKLFGTFQEELAEHKVIYGVRRAVASFNPLWANFHTWVSLLRDAYRTKRWMDKIRIWFMPTGWRPDDVTASYPMLKVKPEELVKFDPESDNRVKIYVLTQYIACLVLGVLFIQWQNQIEFFVQVLVWAFITLPLVSCGYFLEARDGAIRFEMIRLLFTMLAAGFFTIEQSNMLRFGLFSYIAISVFFLAYIWRGKAHSKSQRSV